MAALRGALPLQMSIKPMRFVPLKWLLQRGTMWLVTPLQGLTAVPRFQSTCGKCRNPTLISWQAAHPRPSWQRQYTLGPGMAQEATKAVQFLLILLMTLATTGSN